MIWDADQGKLFFEIAHLNTGILYFTSVAKGAALATWAFEWAGAAKEV